MLSLTHVTIGLASAITIMAPETSQDLYPVMVGASVGSVVCDIDCEYYKSKDALLGRVIAGTLAAFAFYKDMSVQGYISEYINKTGILMLILGEFLILLTGYLARQSEHRVFSHSFLAFLLYVVAIFCLARPVLIPFIIGFVSHLLLDLINFRPVHLLFPYKNGFSLKLCKAKSNVNLGLLAIGTMWLVLLVAMNYELLL